MMATNETTQERWETGRGDGAGIYLAGAPAERAKIGDFSEGGRGDSSGVCHARAALAAAAPEMADVLRTTRDNIRSLNAARVDLGIVPYDAWLAVVEAALAKAEG